MIERILGIDLGIASLGWAVIEHDAQNDANNKIVDCGVRLFTAAETPKEKESPNKARREARGIRRVIKRRRVRMNEIKKLCITNGLLNENDFDLGGGIYNSKANRTDVWKLRHDALRRILTPSELARVMIHIAKHRGYDFQTEEGDAGKVKTAGEELKKKFAEAGCKSIGEYIWLHPYISNERTIRRNKKDDYTISIHRDLLKAEIDEIFASQARFGNTFATDALVNEYKNIAFYVRPMQSIEGMVGYCTFFPKNESKNLKGEKRAPKASPTAERFIALGKFFNTIVIDEHKVEKKLVELKSIEELMALAQSKDKVTFKQLRKELGLSNTAVFKSVHDESKDWVKLSGNAVIKKALSAEMYKKFINNTDIADEVVKILTYYKATSQKENELKKLFDGVVWMNEESIEELSKLSFSAFTQLSIKALKVLNKIMTDGYLRYDEAVRHALNEGLLPSKVDQKSKLLPPLKDTDIDILNPTVIRAFAQFRKVANALVKKYGSFDKVHFELAREVNTKADIKGMIEGQRKNEKEREAAKVWITEYFGSSVPLTRKNILKKRLYEQQSEICPYTGEHIKLERLFDEGYCEIDHILPRSRSADDSMANKVLVMSKANQDKTNRTPFEWFGHDVHAWERYEARINTVTNRSKMGMGKINRLLKKNFDENSEKEFLNRNLNDTRYMARAIKTYCENYWKLAHEDDKLRIQIRSGKLTSELRGRWIEGYLKDRSIHTHHALDAIVIAFATQSMVQKLSTYYGAKETRREKEKPIFKAPMEDFRDAVDKALTLDQHITITAKDGREKLLNRLLISRPPRASVTGAAHKETIQSPSDYKGRGVSVNSGKGVCDNGDMPRVDVFTKEGKYYLVPIYVADFAKPEFPNITAYGEELPENSRFLFSVYKDEIIGITTKATANKPAKEVKGYFVQLIGPSVLLNSFDNGEVEFFRYDNAKKKYVCQLNILNALAVKKYTIDPLGYYHEVKGEKRLGSIPQERKKRGSQGR